MYYEVQWSMIGKEPDSEPFVFRSYSAAIQFLAEELWWLSADLDGAAAVRTREARDKLIDSIEGGKQEDIVMVVNDISYWLKRIEGEIDWRKLL